MQVQLGVDVDRQAFDLNSHCRGAGKEADHDAGAEPGEQQLLRARAMVGANELTRLVRHPCEGPTDAMWADGHGLGLDARARAALPGELDTVRDDALFGPFAHFVDE